MKRTLSGVILAAMLSSQAIATDISQPIHRKGPAISPVYSWSGIYAGAHIGYDWGRARVSDNGVLAESGVPMDGAIGGLLAGVNWQAGTFVYGVEADFGVTKLRGRGTVAAPPIPIVQPPNYYKVDVNGSIRARAGFTVLPTTLIYVAGGLAVADFEFRQGGTQSPISNVLTGWTVGAGIDHSLSQNLLGRVEYLYADYGNASFSVTPNDVYNVSLTSQTLRGALIWSF